jgi:NTP pyrophosphatase (non-canonical NTP hydrolase)
MAFDLKKFQEEHRAWSTKNFGGKFGSGYRPLLGAVEEFGELCDLMGSKTPMSMLLGVCKVGSTIGKLAHHHLKNEQGIRNQENHAEAKKDAIADMLIYLTDYCNNEGFDLEALLSETWEKVRQRDWKKNPDTAHLEDDLK